MLCRASQCHCWPQMSVKLLAPFFPHGILSPGILPWHTTLSIVQCPLLPIPHPGVPLFYLPPPHPTFPIQIPALVGPQQSAGTHGKSQVFLQTLWHAPLHAAGMMFTTTIMQSLWYASSASRAAIGVSVSCHYAMPALISIIISLITISLCALVVYGTKI